MANQLAEVKDQLQKLPVSLPANVPPERFQRAALTALQLNPGLLKCDRKSLFLACQLCAKDGLIPDGREAALVAFGNVVQYMPMVGGIYKRMRNSGDIQSINAYVVYEKDQFDYELGDDERITHKPCMNGDRGRPICVYAVCKTKDGGIYREVMTLPEIERVRSVSRAKDGGPWKTWWDEMARKTVIRRLAKRLPMSSDLEELVRRDDHMYDLTRAPQPDGPAGPVDALNAEVRNRRRKRAEEAVAAVTHQPEEPEAAPEPPPPEVEAEPPTEEPPAGASVDDLF